ncbi:hypothetical protein BGX28_005887 [Mortierella sp. GBA30]|nr:hypothetical protein BGX28_005887 [Mortierella sp. GBA30]
MATSSGTHRKRSSDAAMLDSASVTRTKDKGKRAARDRDYTPFDGNRSNDSMISDREQREQREQRQFKLNSDREQQQIKRELKRNGIDAWLEWCDSKGLSPIVCPAKMLRYIDEYVQPLEDKRIRQIGEVTTDALGTLFAAPISIVPISGTESYIRPLLYLWADQRRERKELKEFKAAQEHRIMECTLRNEGSRRVPIVPHDSVTDTNKNAVENSSIHLGSDDGKTVIRSATSSSTGMDLSEAPLTVEISEGTSSPVKTKKMRSLRSAPINDVLPLSVNSKRIGNHAKKTTQRARGIPGTHASSTSWTAPIATTTTGSEHTTTNMERRATTAGPPMGTRFISLGPVIQSRSAVIQQAIPSLQTSPVQDPMGTTSQSGCPLMPPPASTPAHSEVILKSNSLSVLHTPSIPLVPAASLLAPQSISSSVSQNPPPLSNSASIHQTCSSISQSPQASIRPMAHPRSTSTQAPNPMLPKSGPRSMLQHLPLRPEFTDTLLAMPTSASSTQRNIGQGILNSGMEDTRDEEHTMVEVVEDYDTEEEVHLHPQAPSGRFSAPTTTLPKTTMTATPVLTSEPRSLVNIFPKNGRPYRPATRMKPALEGADIAHVHLEHVRSVHDLYCQWSEGVSGRESIVSLNERYGRLWRHPSDKNYYTHCAQIIQEIWTKINNDKLSLEQALDCLEIVRQRQGNLSIVDLGKHLLKNKASPAEKRKLGTKDGPGTSGSSQPNTPESSVAPDCDIV